MRAIGIVLIGFVAAVPAMAAKPAPAEPVLAKPPPSEPELRLVSSGTGFMVAVGRLLTNDHVVEGCRRMVARNAAGQSAAAQVEAIDAGRDLAMLLVRDDLGPALAFRELPPVLRGEGVVTFGYPLSGLLSSGPTLTTGAVSALSGLRDNPRNFQISAPVQPGSSGGPLLDMQGHVIGVVVSKLNAARVEELTGGDIPQNVNFAVKGAEVVAFLREHGAILRTASGGDADKSAAMVGEVANPSTMFLRCYK
ncbi:MAG: serine protease [Pseudomonadota bacterium]|nr:serine protease [Pseudomonadota bacterium]